MRPRRAELIRQGRLGEVIHLSTAIHKEKEAKRNYDDTHPIRERRATDQEQMCEIIWTLPVHESRRTTTLYDHTSDKISLDEIERIAI